MEPSFSEGTGVLLKDYRNDRRGTPTDQVFLVGVQVTSQPVFTALTALAVDIAIAVPTLKAKP